MNQDDIIRMAREAGFHCYNGCADGIDADLERFFQAAYDAGADAEREEILTYAKSEAFNRMHGEGSPYAYELVNYIRARGQA